MLAPTGLAALIFDSPMDIGVVVLIAVILFGAKKIPEVMRGLGQGIREFKEGMRDEPTNTASASQAAPPQSATSAPVAQTEKK